MVAGAAEPEVIAEDLPDAPEARRIRGVAVPGVAAAIVVGIGLPLTALAVALAADRTTPGPSPAEVAAGGREVAVPEERRGHAHLEGAVGFDGPVTPLACTPGAPRLATLDAPDGRYSILVSVPAGTAPGTYALAPTSAAFVAVTRLTGGAQAWSSFAKAGSTGDVTVAPDGWITARFKALEPNGGGAEGGVDGTLVVGCG